MDTFTVLNTLSAWRMPILLLVVFSLAYIINWIVRRYIVFVINKNTAYLNEDLTKYNSLQNILSIVIYSAAFLFVVLQILAIQ